MALSISGASAAAPCDAPGANAADCGNWSGIIAENPLYASRPPQTPAESLETPPAVTMVMLPDGRILYWGGLEGLEDSDYPLALDAGRSARPSRTRVLDIRNGLGSATWTTPPFETGADPQSDIADHDLFCADQRLLADGRVVAVGGTVWRNDPVDLTSVPGAPAGTAELFGSNATRIFDPATNGWSQGDKMAYGRWYPTLVTLPNGTLFVASGVERLLYNSKGVNVHQTEIFDPASNSWTQNGPDGETTLPLFARLHLLPDGTVFYTGTGQMWSPFGQAYDEALENFQKIYDPATNSWSVAGIGNFGARSGTFSVMLPLRPDSAGAYGTDAQILIGGGTLGTSPGAYVANDITEIVTVSGGTATSVQGPPLNNRRWYSSGVLLPDGSVVAVSGADKDEVLLPGTEVPVRQAEIFDGTSWKPLASASRDRTYHNSAMLLPDGRVLVAGHSPINTLYGPKGDNSMTPLGTGNNMKDPSLEVLEPPYLFRGARPTIDSAPAGVAFGSTFSVDTADAGTVDQWMLVRTPSTTHITDADMRAVELSVQSVDAVNGTVTLQAPPSTVAPPGYYYLFAMRDNGQGLTPSKAHIVRVASTALAGTASAPFGK